MKIVIRAGGIGTRLWPYSRQGRPKQFHAMTGGRTMIQEAVDRILPIVSTDDLFVSTGSSSASLVREQLPDLPEGHLIVEPALRNTGPAVGLECALMETRDPGCVVASLGSDHHIGKPDEFRRLLQAAEAALEDMPDYLFTIGVKPTRIETGYGHIRKGEVLRSANNEPVYIVDQFVEKPDEERARVYTESGDYLWNSNMFVWKAQTVLNLFARYEIEIHSILQDIMSAVGTPIEAAAIEREYPRMKSIAIDNAIIERAERVAVLEGDIDWSDIGSWSALSDVLSLDKDGNLLSGEILQIDAKKVIAYGRQDKLIALVDVENLVVVDTPDALLICRRDQAQRVRDIVDRLNKDERYKGYV